MAIKREEFEYIDTISEATPQNRRRTISPIVDPVLVEKHTSRLSHWPPDHWAQWRMENLKPWRMKSWKSEDSE